MIYWWQRLFKSVVAKVSYIYIDWISRSLTHKSSFHQNEENVSSMSILVLYCLYLLKDHEQYFSCMINVIMVQNAVFQ